MHVQIVNFNLEGMSVEEYHQIGGEVAPAFAQMPGLIAKVWLADDASNTYGGVYLWQDRAAMEAAMSGDLFRTVASNPHFANLTSVDYSVLDEYSRITRGLFAVAA